MPLQNQSYETHKTGKTGDMFRLIKQSLCLLFRILKDPENTTNLGSPPLQHNN